VLVFKGAGTAGDDPVLSFKQATDVAGATNKDLAVITEYWSKQGTLTSVGTWTRVTQAASATVTLDATSAESQGLYYFEIETDQLDTDNGYDCFYLSVADTGTNAQLGCALYIPGGLRYQSTPASLTNKITD